MRRTLISIFMIGSMAGAAMASPHDVFDTFATEGGASHIKISDCGDGTPCGTVIWIDPTTLEPGITPDMAVGRNGEHVLGMTLLKGFKHKNKDWRGGTVYDPENDKMYAARLKRLADGNLQLKGCVGPICQAQVWTLVPTTVASNN